MKLLLTSAGLTNEDISAALLDLTSKQAKDISFVFVPTAANLDVDDKSWLIDDLFNLKKQGFKSIRIVDIAVVSKEIWLPQFEESDVICFGGGSEDYLAGVLEKNNIKKYLLDLLQEKVYMGISAGSMVAGKFLEKEEIKSLFPEEIYEVENKTPLEFVDLSFIPHLNSGCFKEVRINNLENLQNKLGGNVYACDDETALKILDDKIEIVGKGVYWTTDKIN